MDTYNDYGKRNDDPEEPGGTIFVRCHACARPWEVYVPAYTGDYDKNAEWAECAYCGRKHTLKMCIDAEERTNP